MASLVNSTKDVKNYLLKLFHSFFEASITFDTKTRQGNYRNYRSVSLKYM